MKALDLIKADPRVERVWQEDNGGGDYWVMLKTGFADLSDDPWTPTHTIHEWSIRHVQRRLKNVKPCNCKECKP